MHSNTTGFHPMASQMLLCVNLKIFEKMKFLKFSQKLQKWPKSAILALFENFAKNRKNRKIFRKKNFAKKC